jgi:lactate dehydrogenase-like 2-hydroxyacid dehydrogenase
LAKAKNLKLAVTAGVGSDHIDLNAAKCVFALLMAVGTIVT